MKRKLTPKREKFVKLYTDEKNKETFGNGTRSVMESFNVSNENTAGVMANELLRIPNVSQAIEKKILKKEELQAKQGNLVEKLEQFVHKNGVTVENAPIIRELGVNIERNAKLNGDLQERMTNIQINIDRNKDLSILGAKELQEELMRRMQQGYTSEVE